MRVNTGGNEVTVKIKIELRLFLVFINVSVQCVSQQNVIIEVIRKLNS